MSTSKEEVGESIVIQQHITALQMQQQMVTTSQSSTHQPEQQSSPSPSSTHDSQATAVLQMQEAQQAAHHAARQAHHELRVQPDHHTHDVLQAAQQAALRDDTLQDGEGSPEPITHQHTQTQTLGEYLEEEMESNMKDSGDPPPVVYHSVAVQTQTDPEIEAPLYNVITEDGTLVYDEGVRVLRAIGTWEPEYSSSAQITVASEEGLINIHNAVTGASNAPSTAVSDVASAPSASVTPSHSSHSQVIPAATHSRPLAPHTNLSTANKPSVDKAFTCPVCNKGLARKDKLVIHMRIHTGEKPYVCEVCERAFARRDKLVMHMNKLKHLTPTNIAPLGKRQHPVPAPHPSPVPEKRQDTKPPEDSINIEIGSPASSVDLQPAALVQVVHEQPSMTWNCELCGRICTSREEWTAHARSHLDGEGTFSSTSVSSSLSVLTPLSPYQYSASSPERHICMVCRQEFTSKTDFVLHMRGHFVGKPELLASHVAGLVDSSSLCS